MAKQFADIVKLISEKTGMDLTDKSMIDLLSVQATVPDEAFQKVEAGLNGLLTIDSAKHNPIISAHFKAQALLPADSEIKNLLDEFGFDETLRAEIEGEKSTYKKIGNLARKVKELEAKKHEGKSGDKVALTTEIQNLNSQILSLKKDSETQIAKERENAASQIMQYAIESELKGKQYSDSIPESIRITGAKSLLEKELNAKGVKISRSENGELKLVRTDNPDLNYIENNKPISFGEFADKVLSTHAMLKVSDPGKPNGKPAGVTIPNNQANIDPVMQQISQRNLERAAELEAL
jgi:hypothetical protein